MTDDGSWIEVAARSALDVGEMMGVEIGDVSIAIYNVDGEIYATDNMCTHAFAVLTDGFLDGDIIECPLHGGCFKVQTGEGQGSPISENLKTYPVRVVDDAIQVKIS
jgi:nitrite reductase/ring-hydroxylating ferredoxin subunit